MGQVLERWMPTTLAELRDALDEIENMAASLTEDGTHPDGDTIYVNVRHLALVGNKLTDGSVTYDIIIRENK